MDERVVRSGVAAAIALGLLGAIGGPASAQLRPPVGRPDPIGRVESMAKDPLGQARSVGTQPVPPLPGPDQPAMRLVPERRVLDPLTGKETVIPSHYERRITDQQFQVPPLTGYGVRGDGTITVFPGGERPPADIRQGP